MKSRFLFPYYFSWLGWLLGIPGLVLGCFNVFGHFVFAFLEVGHYANKLDYNFWNYTDEVALALTITGLLFIAFSKKKREDELIARIRMDALYWSVLINGLIYILLSPFDMEDKFTYNLATPLIIFIFRFNYLLYFKKDTFIIPHLWFLPYRPWRMMAIIAILASLAAFSYGAACQKEYENLNTATYIMLYIGLFMWTFSKNRVEDELTTQYRMNSMFLAVMLNYLLLLVANFVYYGIDFLAIMIYNMITIPVFFIIIFSFYSIKNSWKKEGQLKGGLLI
jgi:hypothetical protein